MSLRDTQGSVVAEFAVAMPAVLLVLVMLLTGVQAAGLQLQAQDAAADAARSWARGDSSAAVAAGLARQLPGARVSRSTRPGLVCATVTARPRGPSARIGVTVRAVGCALGGGG
ncbi:hypothetical protein BH09ACT4_BH09ACT4_16250 [soil metagenome]